MDAMSEFKITGPGFYKTRDGRKAEVAGRLTGEYIFPWLGLLSDATISWTDYGLERDFIDHPADLIAPWTEPKKGTVWVNVYDDHFMTYTTRDYADRHAVSGRLACVSVNWTEGDGL